MTNSTSRRGFLLNSAGLAGAALAANTPLALAQDPQQGRQAAKKERAPLSTKNYDLKLGVCSYSFREFQRNLAIKMTQELRTPYINIKEFHLPYVSTPEQIKRAVAQFERAGLVIVGGGTIDLQKDTDEDMKAMFEYAKAASMPLIVAAPTRQSLPRVEKFAKQYNIKVAVHNHGPEDKNFPSPYDVLDAVKNLDPLVGLCMDVGHSVRANADVIKACADAGSRLIDLHIKDLADLKVKESQCDVGDGVMPVVALFKQLKRMNYQGCVNLEYEINAEAPLPGMQKSFSYMRGVLDALKA